MKFTQNSVPFDFDGQHLLYMEYREKGIREVFIYDIETREIKNLIRFTKADSIVSHVKLVRGPKNELMLAYV